MITNSRESYQPTSILRWDRRTSGKNWESGRRWGRIISGKRLWRRIPQIRVIGPHSEKCCLKESVEIVWFFNIWASCLETHLLISYCDYSWQLRFSGWKLFSWQAKLSQFIPEVQKVLLGRTESPFNRSIFAQSAGADRPVACLKIESNESLFSWSLGGYTRVKFPLQSPNESQT
jgi:hypothetical protein